jgi:hypothetical protein
MIAKFTSKLEKSPNKGGWTYATWDKTAEIFGTHGAVKIRGTVDGYPVETSFMAMGDGVQMLPIKSEIRKAIGKEAGDVVEIIIQERL